jgi:hypothetical protein
VCVCPHRFPQASSTSVGYGSQSCPPLGITTCERLWTAVDNVGTSRCRPDVDISGMGITRATRARFGSATAPLGCGAWPVDDLRTQVDLTRESRRSSLGRPPLGRLSRRPSPDVRGRTPSPGEGEDDLVMTRGSRAAELVISGVGPPARLGGAGEMREVQRPRTSCPSLSPPGDRPEKVRLPAGGLGAARPWGRPQRGDTIGWRRPGLVPPPRGRRR